MGLDLVSFLDYGFGGSEGLVGFFGLVTSVSLCVFISFFGFFWVGSCREWVSLMLFFEGVEMSILKDKSVKEMVGMPQLVFCLFLTLISIAPFSFGPLVFPLASQIWVPLSLAFPFWGGSVVYGFFNMNWQGFLSKFVAGDHWFATFLFLGLEMVTISFRVITLSARMTFNVLVSLICAKLLFSFTVGTLWLEGMMPTSLNLSSDLSGVSIFSSFDLFMGLSKAVMYCGISWVLCLGYYMFEWGMGLLQSWLFTFLVVSYFDEGRVSFKESVISASKRSN